MLINVLRVIRSLNPTVSIAVPNEVPGWIREEFNVIAVPTLMNCWGRWHSISIALSLPRWLDRLGTPIYRTFSTILLGITSRLPQAWIRRIPGMEGEYIRCIRTARVVWATGGGYLTDVGSTEARAILATLIHSAHCGAATAMSGQGLGPFDSRVTRSLMRTVSRNAVRIVTREGTTGPKILAALNVRPDRYCTGVDDACSLPSHGTTLSATCPAIAIHYRRSPFHRGSEDVENAMLETIAHAISEGHHIHLFVFHEKSDSERSIYQNWINILNEPNRITIVEEKDPRLLRSRLGQCRTAIGMAYHFFLFALLEGVPALALYAGDYYKVKLDGVMENFSKGARILTYQSVAKSELTTWLSESRQIDSDALRESARQLSETADSQLRSILDVTVS